MTNFEEYVLKLKSMRHFTLPKEGGLIEKDLPYGVLHAKEKVFTNIFEDEIKASEYVAKLVVDAINEKKGERFTLGLTTGVTPVTLYQKICAMYKEGKVSFRNVEIFSIDEYYPIDKGSMQSRNYRLHCELLDNIDILHENIHIPDGDERARRGPEYCAEFEEKARGIDLMLLGIGENGQVAFNESGSSEHSRMRTVMFQYESRKKQSRNFNGRIEDTPKGALTMGIGTMMSAKRIVMMAWGEAKSAVVGKVVEGDIDSSCPATYFQRHSNIELVIDEIAASNLSRRVAPWTIGPCEWTTKLKRKAVIWLCQQVDKPILKLTMKDYLQNSLGELLDIEGSFDKVNIDVFNDLQHTITGWPGGKPNADDSTRPVPSTPFPKTVLIFSPHPDDDVISMGGTFIRLVHQGHNVHVAYETSGDLAVHDDVVMQHLDAMKQLGVDYHFDETRALIDSKIPGEPEPKDLLAMKAAIRRSEARAADYSFGVKMKNVHFLNLPFYESGGVKKLPCTQVDIDIIKKLVKDVHPDQIYMAGDLADPHGTHRVCTEAALEAIEQLKEEGEKWLENSNIWLYRGAWMEWELGSVDMAVPISPDEVIEKRHAIFRHLSQKDIVPFPGEDPREFWQRAEDRTQETAHRYDKLGMAEYQAMEVFLKLV